MERDDEMTLKQWIDLELEWVRLSQAEFAETCLQRDAATDPIEHDRLERRLQDIEDEVERRIALLPHVAAAFKARVGRGEAS